LKAFLEAMADAVPDDERVLVSSVPNDPQESRGEMWNVRPWRFGDSAPPAHQNNYVCVSSFRKGGTGWRRTADLFGRALAFMVDDVGTKVAREAVAGLQPTHIVRTSPDNEQWWYLFSEPVTSYELFSRLISAFVQQKLGGKDPGMGGANRIGRLADGINGKAQYRSPTGEPFHCEALFTDFTRKFTLPQLVEAFGLTLGAERVRNYDTTTIPAEEIEKRADSFKELFGDCEMLGLLLKRHSNHAGRIPIVCPWYKQHTGESRTGTYLVEPNDRNNFHGSFVCFHSSTHSDDNHLKDIKQWATEVLSDRFEIAAHSANRRAPTTLEQLQQGLFANSAKSLAQRATG
jgi:hypothetical protein